ncbi:MAG TPA: L-seryl-tRNA(Sec) selenium transferase [Candidatus Krumholzibacteria bacterium]|nr:L-seryl-tRNA(Sec) selenium transferase [Candidatus Krumholzibacteria bacterium]
MQELLRRLPSLNALLERRTVKGLLRHWRRDVIVNLARGILDEERSALRRGRGLSRRYGQDEPTREALLGHCERRLSESLESLSRPKLRRVLNATGVILHTNLGRARLSERVADEVRRVAGEPCALEIDIGSNRRGSRNARVGEWLQLLTGAEAGVAVNNGAAALWLAVRALATRGRSMIVSRGEQVAIGGSFRMPELMHTTGARVVEVGTTNKTSARDYAAVVAEGDLVLKVHPSNYRIEGFHEEASLADLAAICRERGAHLVFDAGSGSLYDYGQFGLSGEQTVAESLEAGADLVTFSGDKLLGGPQAGLAVGREELVQRMARHPLMRALRLDKMALVALETTLASYAEAPERAKPALPLFDALGTSVAELRRRAGALADRLAPRTPEGWRIAATRSTASIGGGSFAEHPVESAQVECVAPSGRAAEALHRALRRGDPAILARIDDDRVEFDLRSVREDELEELAAGMERAFSEISPARGSKALERRD